jgi:hypothetical protein
MIAQSEINTLHTADKLKEVAKGTPERLLREAIARACNLAANTGELSTGWTGVLTDDIKAEVEAKGIAVTAQIGHDMRPMPNSWIFSWR